MKIRQIKVRNFRLLKDFSIDIEPELSLIVGKNNVGKTSLLYVMDKFLNGGADSNKRFHYQDFNLDFQNEIETMLDADRVDEENYAAKSISLRIIAEYTSYDRLDNIGNRILTNLETGNNYFALGFDYVLDYSGYGRLIEDYQVAKSDFDNKHTDLPDPRPQFNKVEYMKANQSRYFHVQKRSIQVNKDDMTLDETKFVDLSSQQGFRLDDIINFQYITARRRVDNKDPDKTLSGQTSEIYNAQEESQENEDARNEFVAHLRETDDKLTGIYDKLFDDMIKKVAKLGGMKRQETVIKVISTLQHRELLKGNTTVVYEHDNRELPENYNGLGYMNLISIIFEISLIVERMKRAQKRRPADINLLFIEEPEAHTHPQMQYVFIKNIKTLLTNGIKREDGEEAELQYIVSTHSSHIVADSDFDDIKYLKRIQGENSVESKNLKDLKKLYGEENDGFRFLKQYLTLMNSELFFADKAIFVEGDTERILIPVMMQKVDQTDAPDEANGEMGLLSQNISVLPIGAHSHIFARFFNFIGLSKLLVITDIDVCETEGHHKKCEYVAGNDYVTSNAALKNYFGRNEVSYYKNLNILQKRLKWDEAEQKMKPDTNGNMMVCYQTEVDGYQPRSFEDCFFNENQGFICNGAFDKFALDESALNQFKVDKRAFDLAEKGVVSKASLAISILLAEKDDNNWIVPAYIKEGLLWMRS